MGDSVKETIKNLKRVWIYGREFKRSVIIFTLLSVFFIGINIVTPVIAANQIVFLSTNKFHKLLIVSLLVLFIDLVRAIAHWVLRRNTQIFFRGTTKNIQMATAKEILKITATDIDHNSSGTFIQRIGNDTDEMSKIFTRGMGFLVSIITDFGIFVAIFIINKIVFVAYLLSSTLLTILHLLKTKAVNERDKKYRNQREKTAGLVGELVRGVRDIKMLNAKDSFVDEIERNIDDLTKSQFEMRNTDMNYNAIIDSISSIIEFLIIVLMVYLIDNGVLTIALALVLHNYEHRVLGNLIFNLGELLMEIKSFNLSCNRVFGILDNEFSKEEFGKKHIKKIKGNFEFENVYFGYGEEDVLKGLSFKIKENETIGFVGKSGVGKTTIFSLLCKLYNIRRGKILIDGHDINELDEESIRDNITIISQNPYIFNLSIRDNLRLVKSDLTEKEMREACHNACLDDFINALPDKYDTIVGEGGVKLSGGQRQRLAIARAFVQKTKIILFDEATSALDNETQSNIQRAINNMKGDYTILIIAHRLSTIVNCKRIMLIDDGKIVGSGTHKELLKNNKKYKKLYDTELLEK